MRRKEKLTVRHGIRELFWKEFMSPDLKKKSESAQLVFMALGFRVSWTWTWKLELQLELQLERSLASHVCQSRWTVMLRLPAAIANHMVTWLYRNDQFQTQFFNLKLLSESPSIISHPSTPPSSAPLYILSYFFLPCATTGCLSSPFIVSPLGWYILFFYLFFDILSLM